MLVRWQVFGLVNTDDPDEFVDELYDAVNWLDGATVSGVDWEEAD